MKKKSLAVFLLIMLGFGAQSSSTAAGHKNPLTSTSYFDSPCSKDTKTPAYWKKLEAHLSSLGLCNSGYRYVPVTMPKSQPISKYSSQSPAKVESCKIDNYKSAGTRAFSANNDLHLNPKTKMQVLPLYSSDTAPGTGNPSVDYSGYFKYLKDFVGYVSDGPSDFSIKVPNKYYKLAKPLSTYKTDDPLTSQARDDFVAAVDSSIDFTGIDYVYIVYPPGTSIDVASQAGFGKNLQTQEGEVKHVMTSSPLTYKKGKGFHTTAVLHPMNLLHEMFHPGAKLEDHNGSGYWQNANAGNPDEVGMGNWGLMSHSMTDLLTWEKWLLGFTLDEQIFCQTSFQTKESYWLAPSGVKTTKQKLLVLKISEHEVLVVESARAAGFNYKLPKSSEGAIVYTVNTEETRWEYGLTLLRPKGTAINAKPFVLSNSSLQKGEYVTYKGIKIQVTEAGPFGDVVTISK
jgi:hypothetical protein